MTRARRRARKREIDIDAPRRTCARRATDDPTAQAADTVDQAPRHERAVVALHSGGVGAYRESVYLAVAQSEETRLRPRAPVDRGARAALGLFDGVALVAERAAIGERDDLEVVREEEPGGT